MKKVYGVKEGNLYCSPVLFVCESKEDALQMARATRFDIADDEIDHMVVDLPVVESLVPYNKINPRNAR